MTAATYRTIREACGLSQQAAADLFRVSLATIKHWEVGRNHIPAGAIAELLALNAALERGVAGALATWREAEAEHGPADVVTLTRYREADYAGSRAAAEGLPWPCHCAMIGRALIALERAGARVAVVTGARGVS